MEELDNLEETLNDSIRESVGARSGKSNRGSHKASLGRKMTLLGMYPDIYDLCLQQVWYLYVEI